MSISDNPIYHNEDAARAHIEGLRWPNGTECPHCGVVRNSTLLNGETTRSGLYKCNACRKPYTVTMGTIYEKSHIPLHKWLLATRLMCSSKKGISASQLQRDLGIGSYRTAWFMAHRIREAMQSDDITPMGINGGKVEADETFIGIDQDAPKNRMAIRNMNKIVTLLDRETGQTRSVVIKNINMHTITEILQQNVSKSANLVTDEAHYYKTPCKIFASHNSVNHSQKEYVNKADTSITTNQIEGFFGIFKRGMRGIYQHCKSHHLQRYLNEFDFRYSNRKAMGIDDAARAALVVKGGIGKRLLYRRPKTEGFALIHA